MKKFSILMIVLTMLMSLCACKGEENNYDSATATDITDKQLQELIEQAEQARTENVG